MKGEAASKAGTDAPNRNADDSSASDTASDGMESKPNGNGQILALKDLTLDIGAGEKVALCGRSGRYAECLFASPSPV